MKRIIVLLALVSFFVFIKTPAFAQTEPGYSEERKEPNSRHHQTYFKVGWSHVNSAIENFDISINGLTIDVETYFNREHSGFSGWFVGYRKDNVSFTEFGHVLNLGLIRTIDTPIFDFRLGGGIEWGITSPEFNKTRFKYRDGSLIEYRHLFLKKNISIPWVKPSHNSVIYPLIEASLVKRGKYFIVESGIRTNIQRFGLDTYNFSEENLGFTPNDRIKFVPSFFIKLGLSFSG